MIGENAQNMSYLSIVATEHKTRQRRARHLMMRVKARKARKSEGVQGPQSSRLVTGNGLNNVRFQKNSSGMSYYRSLCAGFLYIFFKI